MASLRSLETGEVLVLRESTTVGRAPGNDLVLATETVSSRHAVLEWRDGAWWLRDAGSTNGTAVDGRRIAGRHALAAGATLHFGPDCAWTVRDVDPPAEAGEGGPPRLVSRASGACYPLHRDRFVIGTGPSHDLCLPARDAAGEGAMLAVLHREDGGTWLSAVLGAVEGPWGRAEPGGAPVPLESGTAFRVAGVDLEFSAPGTAAAGSTRKAAPEGEEKVYAYRLVLTRSGEIGDVEVADGPVVRRWPDQRLRFDLLWVLAAGLPEVASSPVCEGPPEPRAGWIRDVEVEAALWGARGASRISPATLPKLIWDTRGMLAQGGVDGWFIEKKAGRTRLRLRPDQVERRSQ